MEGFLLGMIDELIKAIRDDIEYTKEKLSSKKFVHYQKGMEYVLKEIKGE